MIISTRAREIIAGYFNSSPPDHTGSLVFTNISGGCINECYKVTDSINRSLFVKINSRVTYPGLLQKEMQGLSYLAKQHIIKTPMVAGCEEEETFQLLMMEWIEQSEPVKQTWEKLGEQLANLHQVTNFHFGFEEDNYIGSIPQANTWQQNWATFFVEHRLKPQIDLAVSNNQLTRQYQPLFEKLFIALPDIFEDEKPGLLHGDLWRGNLLFNDNNNPVLIDPSVYFGSRHMDLAMTTLFGGFDPAFYDAYHYHYSLPQNHKQLWEICNLYPLLVHVNLFGQSYVPPVLSILKKYI